MRMDARHPGAEINTCAIHSSPCMRPRALWSRCIWTMFRSISDVAPNYNKRIEHSGPQECGEKSLKLSVTVLSLTGWSSEIRRSWRSFQASIVQSNLSAISILLQSLAVPSKKGWKKFGNCPGNWGKKFAPDMRRLYLSIMVLIFSLVIAKTFSEPPNTKWLMHHKPVLISTHAEREVHTVYRRSVPQRREMFQWRRT